MQRVFSIILSLIVLSIGSTALVFFLDSQEIGKVTWTNEAKPTSAIIVTPKEEVLPLLLPELAPSKATSTEEMVLEGDETTTTTPEDAVQEEIVVEVPEIVIPPLPEIEEEPELIIETDVPEDVELSFGDINTKTRDALVNILCLTKGPHATINPISGSGIIINEKGVILTNAHIAQYFLLKDYPEEGFVNCIIRTGSPAKSKYKASLLYLSPPWINENSKAIVTERPEGTGEHDFALLVIDDTTDGSVLPSSFPFIEPQTESGFISKGDEVLVGAYPAGFLGGKTIQQSLYASTALTEAMEIYTFSLENGFLDVISLGGTVVAQQGSSGGAAVNSKGKLVGLISTSSDGDTTGDRDLRAISLEHVERSLNEHNKTTLRELLNGDLNEKAAAFTDTAAPTLLQIIISSFLNN